MLPLEHSAILLTFIKLPVVIKTLLLSIFVWPFYTGFTVLKQENHVQYFLEKYDISHNIWFKKCFNFKGSCKPTSLLVRLYNLGMSFTCFKCTEHWLVMSITIYSLNCGSLFLILQQQSSIQAARKDNLS